VGSPKSLLISHIQHPTPFECYPPSNIAGWPYAGFACGVFDFPSMLLRSRSNTFSTPHSNGINKVIDTPCTFLLSSPVYTEAHPRRSAVFASRMNLRDAALAASCISSNSFASYSFRTLATHLKATVSSNSFAINRFRTLCKIPGIGYPPPSILFPTPSRRVRSASARIAHFLAPRRSEGCAISPLLAALLPRKNSRGAFLMGGGGRGSIPPASALFPASLTGPGGLSILMGFEHPTERLEGACIRH
jgi:hypothetical protein